MMSLMRNESSIRGGSFMDWVEWLSSGNPNGKLSAGNVMIPVAEIPQGRLACGKGKWLIVGNSFDPSTSFNYYYNKRYS